MPSRLSWLAQSSAVATLAGVSAFFVYTKHVKVQDFDPASDPVFSSVLYRKFNPQQNIPLTDEAVRRVPLWKVKRELVDDAEKGGSKLVEAFTGGIWGGSGNQCWGSGKTGYSLQRKVMESKYRNDSTTAHQLWEREELLKSSYEVGTEITDHFNVLEKSKDRIVLRCGDSPRISPDGPRASDGLCEVTAKADMEKGFAEFRFRFWFYSGVGKTETKPLSEMGGILDWLHKQYAALLVESALKNVLA